tara:strand:- start:165 stop:311 length:147 start_codon:yes stop_codon:yes gene_type:complete
MEIYNPSEFSRPSAIASQFEVLVKHIKDLEAKTYTLMQRIEDLESRGA